MKPNKANCHLRPLLRDFRFLPLLLLLMISTHAQDEHPVSLDIGDPAPPVRVRSWLKGKPVQQFEKGRVYVIEFWATWCRPCIAAMPHLSALANEYRKGLTVLGVDIYEWKTTSPEKVQAFVDSMGNRMDYSVAASDTSLMVADWIYATGAENDGIPRSFVVDKEGRLAWIGHPMSLDKVLFAIVNDRWDLKEASTERKRKKHLAELDSDASFELAKYRGDPSKPGDMGKPDSILAMINEMLKKEPGLKYMPAMAGSAFLALLRTNPSEAYQFGKEMLAASTLENSLNHIIYTGIIYSNRLDLPAEIYYLGVEASQADIDQYAESMDIAGIYHKMAELYWRAKDNQKAVGAEEKAIAALKSRKGFSKTKLAEWESRLAHYKGL